jgi:hypothetical protein
LTLSEEKANSALQSIAHESSKQTYIFSISIFAISTVSIFLGEKQDLIECLADTNPA